MHYWHQNMAFPKKCLHDLAKCTCLPSARVNHVPRVLLTIIAARALQAKMLHQTSTQYNFSWLDLFL